MQSKQGLETIRRIEAKFGPVYEGLQKLQSGLYGSPTLELPFGRLVIEVTYLLGDFIETIQRDAYSTKVIEAFHLREPLLQKEFWFQVADALPSAHDAERQLSPARDKAMAAWQTVRSELIVPYER